MGPNGLEHRTRHVDKGISAGCRCTTTWASSASSSRRIVWGDPLSCSSRRMRFIKRPSVWLDTIHRHRGPASFAPNFAYALATRRVQGQRPREVGPVLPQGARLRRRADPARDHARVHRAVRPTHCGMPDTAILPAYGMAEATLAISLKPAPEHMKHARGRQAEIFEEDRRGRVRARGRPTSPLEWVACGIPFEGHEVVVDERGQDEILGDGKEGELCFTAARRSPPGYFNNPEATAKPPSAAAGCTPVIWASSATARSSSPAGSRT